MHGSSHRALRPLASIAGALLVATAPRAACGQAVRTVAAIAVQGISARDSARLVDRARGAQRAFESVRRWNLPRDFGGGSGGRCDVTVGRWCYWNDDGPDDPEPPPESDRIQRARAELLAQLDSIAARIPGDRFLTGQRVRYLIEAGRTAEALDVARRCGATGGDEGWCGALAGLVHHLRGEYVAAERTFDAALAAMPEAERCRWEDVSPLLDDAIASRYDRLGCAGRDTMAARIWRIAAPLYLLGANDLRTEFLARQTMARLEAGTANAQGMPWGDDTRELLLRYGWSRYFRRVDPSPGSLATANVIGYGRSSGFHFLPAPRALAAPESLGTDDWTFRDRRSRTRYAPDYARSIHPLSRLQIASFRRGDSLLVVAVYDAREDTTVSRHPVDAGLFVLRADAIAEPPAGEPRHDAEAAGTLSVLSSWRDGVLVASVELLDRESRGAARARLALHPPRAGGRVAVSDLLLYAPRDSTPHRLADALPLAIASSVVRADQPLGLFWETYGLRPQGELLTVALTIEPVESGWLRRAVERLGLLTHSAPIRVQWQEVPDRGTSVASRAAAVSLARLAAGRYRVRLALTPADQPAVVAEREIEVAR